MPAELAAPMWGLLFTAAWPLMLLVVVGELRGEQRHVDPWPPGELRMLYEAHLRHEPVPLIGRPPLLPQPTYPTWDGWSVGDPSRSLAVGWREATGEIPVTRIGGGS